MNKFYFSLVFLTFFGCSQNTSTYDEIDEFLTSKHSINLSEFQHLVIINEMGGCMTCSNRFAELMAEHVEQEEILFLICSPGSRIDISPYMNEQAENIVHDFRNKFADLKIVDHGAIIHLKNESIDTIIEIDASNIDENMIRFNETIES